MEEVHSWMAHFTRTKELQLDKARVILDLQIELEVMEVIKIIADVEKAYSISSKSTIHL